MSDFAMNNFEAVFTGLIVLFVVVFCVVIALGVRNYLKVRRSGHDPMTLETDLAIKLLDSDALRGEKSIEDRLEAIDRLRASGTISEQEYAATRQKILGQA